MFENAAQLGRGLLPEGTLRSYAKVRIRAKILGLSYHEFLCDTQDPLEALQEVKAELRPHVICLWFHDRPVVHRYAAGTKYESVGEPINRSNGLYFVNVEQIVQRHELANSAWDKSLLDIMDKSRTDQVVTWGEPYPCAMSYRPRVDRLIEQS